MKSCATCRFIQIWVGHYNRESYYCGAMYPNIETEEHYHAIKFKPLAKLDNIDEENKWCQMYEPKVD